MKRIRLLGLALIALIALGAFASASAFAENPEILPVPTEKVPLTFTVTSGTAVLQNTIEKAKVTCKTSKGKGSFTTQDKGKISELDFEGCESNKVPCKSAGDAEGTILMKAGIQLVDVLPTGTLDLGILIEKPEERENANVLKFECGVGLKAEVKGSVIGVVDNNAGSLLLTLEKATKVKALFTQTGLGEQTIKECDLLKLTCEGKKFSLESNLGKGVELSAEIVESTITFASEAEVHF